MSSISKWQEARMSGLYQPKVGNDLPNKGIDIEIPPPYPPKPESKVWKVLSVVFFILSLLFAGAVAYLISYQKHPTTAINEWRQNLLDRFYSEPMTAGMKRRLIFMNCDGLIKAQYNNKL